MLIFIATGGHTKTVAPLVDRSCGSAVPDCVSLTYDALCRAAETRRAVHVFTDIERLSNQGLVVAARLYRSLRAAGLPCLNDPAKVMARHQLLANLYAVGINPFRVFRADGLPRPQRFPVFVRGASDHDGPLSDLLEDQRALDRCLAALVEAGRPLRGLLVIEYAAEPIAPGLWRRMSTFRVGGAFCVNNGTVERKWAVKDMDPAMPPEIFEDERAAIAANAVPEPVRRAFALAGIEWGRADHALFGGRHVVYEINTNPECLVDIDEPVAREPAMAIAKERLTGFLRDLDWGDGAPVGIEPALSAAQKPRRNLLSAVAGAAERLTAGLRAAT
jgi:hypothetical protein